METLENQKTKLRKQTKLPLKSMDKEKKQRLDHQIFEHLKQLEEFQKAKFIYGYASLSWEAGTEEILEWLWKMGKEVALPKVFGCEMKFFRVTSRKDLEEGKFHIMEPGNQCEMVDWPEALVLVPGLVFSKNGNRLGKGGGYYDRYLNQYPNHPTIALAYDFQIIEEVPHDEQDRSVDQIVTESGMISHDRNSEKRYNWRER